MPDFSAATVNAEIRRKVIEVIDHSPGVNVKDQIRAAARALRLSFGRVRKYRYGEVRRIDAHEAEQIKHFATPALVNALNHKINYYNELRERTLAEAARDGDHALAALLPPAAPVEKAE